jgi:hypothetical protein
VLVIVLGRSKKTTVTSFPSSGLFPNNKSHNTLSAAHAGPGVKMLWRTALSGGFPSRQNREILPGCGRANQEAALQGLRE